MPKRLQLITIRPKDSLLDALKAIDRGGCEIALVADEGHRLLGVLTDGDIRRAVLRNASLNECAHMFMKRQYVSVQSNAGRAEVLDIMRARSITQIPILDKGGRLLGLHLLREIIGAVVRPNWAVIMAGGRGERLRPLTDSLPKPMIRVAGRPILERLVLHLVGHGIRTIFLAINYKSHLIEDYFGDGRTFGCRINYLREKKSLGTGGALAFLPRRLEDPLLILNGDLVTQINIEEMLAKHRQNRNLLTVGVHEHLYTVPFGVLRERWGRVLKVQEKPTASWLVNAGIYIIEPDLLRRIPRGREFPLPALLEDCLERSERVGVFHIEEEWMDVGRIKELKKARGEE